MSQVLLDRVLAPLPPPFALLHRPMTNSGARIWISFSPDLHNCGGHKLLLDAADTSVTLATGSVREPRRWLAEHGS